MIKTGLNILVALWVSIIGMNAQVNWTKWQGNLSNTGANTQETQITPANVANSTLQFTHTLDGSSYSQPLYLSGLQMSDGNMHNVIYLTTEHDGVYAFDADNVTGANANPLWYSSLLPTGTTTVPATDAHSSDIPYELGITATPVIDNSTKTLYIVTKVKTTATSTYQQYLHALDVTSGAEKFGGPVLISATFHGVGGFNDNQVGGTYAFSALGYHDRAALTLSNGVVYITYASHEDYPPYHGLVLGFNATSLALVKQFIATPNGNMGGMWMSGASPAIDGAGNLYTATGNGSFDQTASSYTTDTDWGETFIKLPPTGTFDIAYSNPLNWFTPNNYTTLTNNDLDIASGGVLLLPDQAGPHPHVLVGGGKGGVLFVIDRDNLGGLNTTHDNAVQEITYAQSLFGTPCYFNGNIYYAPSSGPLTQRAVGYNAVDGSYVSTTANTSTATFFPGTTAFVSANGTTNGIVWLCVDSRLLAYNATNVTGNPIFTYVPTLPSPVTACTMNNFALPLVINGKIYFTAYESTSGHAISHLFVMAPTTAVTAPNAPSALTATSSSGSTATLNWTDNSTNETGFKVKRATAAAGPYTQVGLTATNIPTYTDTGLSPQTTYYYQVVATNSVGDSTASNTATVTTQPPYSAPGIVAYWNFDENGGGVASDSTVNGHTGTVSGEVTWVPGKTNSALSFHGTGAAISRVVVPASTAFQFAANQSFTLAAWVQEGATRTADEAVIAASRDQGNYYGVWINTANQWVFRGPGADIVGPTASIGTWTYVTAVQDGAAGTRTLYINGAVAATGTAQAANGAGDFWIAQANGVTQPFPGIIDEVRVYNTALSAGAIASLYGSTPMYTLTVTNGTGSGNYAAGTVVTVAANPPASGYQFSAWTGATGALANPAASTTTLTMPAAAASIAANYTTTGTNLVANGTYQVVGLNSGLTMVAAGTTNGAIITQQSYTGTTAQQWTVTNLSTNIVKMVVPSSTAALEVPGASMASNVALDVSNYTGATSQQWTTTSVGGYVELLNVNSGMAANVNGASKVAGTQLMTYAAGNYTNEEWTFNLIGGGTPFPLTVNSGTGTGSYTAGTLVTVTANAASSGYQFSGWTGATGALADPTAATTTLTMPGAATTITASYTPTSTYLVPDGNYKAIVLCSGLAMSANGTTTGSAVSQQNYTAVATQQWTITNLGSNVVKMVVSGTTEALEVPGSSMASSVPLDISNYTGGTNQQWTATTVSGYTQFLNVNSGMAVNLNGGGSNTGTQFMTYASGNYSNEKFTMTSTSGGGGTTYALTVNNGTGGGSYTAGAVVTVTANAPAGGYQFSGWSGATGALTNPAATPTTLTMPAAAATITANYSPTSSNLVANGTYNVVGLHSGLSIASNGTTNAAAVWQQVYTGTAIQKWTVTNLGSNVIEMVVSGTSEAMEVPGASLSVVYLDISAYTGATCQQWTATSVGGYIELLNVNSGMAANVNGASMVAGTQIMQYAAGNYSNEQWTFAAP
jgi:uncharacterized repeat protein (TIGR02543 family)